MRQAIRFALSAAFGLSLACATAASGQVAAPGSIDAQHQSNPFQPLLPVGKVSRGLRIDGVPQVSDDFGLKPGPTDPASLGPRLGVDVKSLIKKLEEVQTPSSPGVGTIVLSDEIKALKRSCSRQRIGCGDIPALQASLAKLNSAIAANPTCSDATDAYLRYYPDTAAPNAVRTAYDLACLGSFEPRAGATVGDPPPAIFQPGPTSALSAVGLLENEGRPICAGLLRNDRTFITARHCFERAALEAWKGGRLQVRPADGRSAPWPIGDAFVNAGASASLAVSEDWAIVRLTTADAIGAPQTELKVAATTGEVTLIGYFVDHVAASYGSAASKEDWRRGLRWPRPGFCQAVREEDPDCVKLVCQTVKGFSGTPVFAAPVPAAGQPLQVVGFISRPSTSEDASCGAAESYITLAAAARAVQP